MGHSLAYLAPKGEKMKKGFLWVFLLLLVAAGGGVAFLAAWDIPAPTASVERVIPDERFPR